METQHFQTIIEKAGGKAVIRLPFDPDAVWGEKDRHHITGAVHGCAIRGPLGVDGDGSFLALGLPWLRDSGVAVGDAVQVELKAEGPKWSNWPTTSARP